MIYANGVANILMTYMLYLIVGVVIIFIIYSIIDKYQDEQSGIPKGEKVEMKDNISISKQAIIRVLALVNTFILLALVLSMSRPIEVYIGSLLQDDYVIQNGNNYYRGDYIVDLKELDECDDNGSSKICQNAIQKELRKLYLGKIIYTTLIGGVFTVTLIHLVKKLDLIEKEEVK